VFVFTTCHRPPPRRRRAPRCGAGRTIRLSDVDVVRLGPV